MEIGTFIGVSILSLNSFVAASFDFLLSIVLVYQLRLPLLSTIDIEGVLVSVFPPFFAEMKSNS